MFQMVAKSIVPLDKYYGVKGEKTKSIFKSKLNADLAAEADPTATIREFDDWATASLWVNGELKIYTSDGLVNLPKIYGFACGHWNKDSKLYGFGGWVVCGEKKFQIRGSGNEEDGFPLRATAGEIIGVECILRYAEKMQFPKITIIHNHSGIKSWATENRKHRREFTKEYMFVYQSIANNIETNFLRVSGCHGLPGRNDAAIAAFQEALKGETIGAKIYQTPQFKELSPELIKHDLSQALAEEAEEKRLADEKAKALLENKKEEEKDENKE